MRSAVASPADGEGHADGGGHHAGRARRRGIARAILVVQGGVIERCLVFVEFFLDVEQAGLAERRQHAQDVAPAHAGFVDDLVGAVGRAEQVGVDQVK
jgi:hypothetical protein